MHAAELTHLAALVSWHSPALIQCSHELSAASIDQYWTSSRLRQDHWVRQLQASNGSPSTVRNRRCGELEEILLSEVLTRVWTAIVSAHDGRCEARLTAPIARSVFLGHQQARNLVLKSLMSPQLPARAAVALNGLRRRAERWTDLLIAQVMLEDSTAVEFAFDRERAAEFADDLSATRGGSAAEDQARRLTLAALEAAFRPAELAPSPNADLNSEIAAGVLSCFPSDLFDSIGLIHSLWQVRLEHITADTQGLLEEVLALESPPVNSPASMHRWDG